MRALGLGNKGYITIEMCMVMPIIIGVIMLLIMLILRAGNEGMALGISQVVAYGISGESFSMDEEDASDELTQLDKLPALEKVQGYVSVKEDELKVDVRGGEEGYAYSMTQVGCVREWNMCTDRLRRWQLYGDVLCE